MKGILASLLIKLGLDSKEFKSGMTDAKRETNKFGDYMKRVGGMIAGAFAVDRLIAFGKELVNLSGEAEGVRAAFERIGGMPFLDDMKDATAGTVNELNLMKRAVQARNLGIPIENLSSLFEFATKRAQETGQSVDYLVDSIVLGIGRKSPLILDNLGISAVQLREKLKGVGTETASVADIAAAVGQIAADSMRESGGVIETNAIKVQQLKTAWDDFKLSVAESSAFKDTVGFGLDYLINAMTVLGSTAFTTTQKIAALTSAQGLQSLAVVAKAVAERQKEASDAIDEYQRNIDIARGKIPPATTTIQQNSAALEESAKKAEEAAKRMQDLADAADKMDAALMDGLAKIKEGFDADKFWDELLTPKDVKIDMSGIKLPEEQDLPNLIDTKSYAKQLEDFNQFKEDFAAAVMDFSVEVVDQLGTAFGELIRTGEFPEDFGNQVLGIIGGFISQLGKMLIALGAAALGFQDLLKSAFTNPASAAAAIAAGAALVLLGGAIKGFASAGPRGSGGGGGGGFSVSSQSYSAAAVGTSGKTSQNMDINVTGVLKGDSIYLSNQRTGFKRAVIG